MNSTSAHGGVVVDAPPGLWADIVFDRPLDQSFSYAVPAELAPALAVGKRVEVPFGRGDSRAVGYVVNLSSREPTFAVKEIAAVIDDEALLTDPIMRLTRWMADYYLCGWGQVLHAVLPAGVRDGSGTREAAFLELVPDDELPSPPPRLTEKQTVALEAAKREARPLEARELAKIAECGTAPVSALLEKGYLRKFLQRIEKIDLSAKPGEDYPRFPLNSQQEAAFAPILAALTEGGYKSFLLHGATGSGKTEVYLRAIEEVIARGREVIVLVPEISLTPQTLARFRGRCGEVAVLHSHLTDAERGAHWRRVAAGKVQVIVGARSAVFAPTRKLGLIIIDEEHETSFKQESTPRYHARDVAVMRAKLENVPIVMGSATPALETWANAKKGNYTLLSMPSRVMSRPMPEVRLIDLRHEKKQPGAFFAVGPTLEAEMKRALDAGGQVILFLNRRGYSTHVHCADCGHVVTCNNCDLAMTFHRGKAALMCHFCGFEQPPMQTCPACKVGSLRYQGMGTEKLQAEVESRFPGKVCQRMDSDTMQRPGSHEKVLDAFRRNEIQILLGTQMIAKGLDFPNVTLVGVVNADVGLHLPDFRAAERTFQLLAQVAGRAGRGDDLGRVLVQTFTPEHPCIELASRHDYVTFADAELAQRGEHQYPPFQRLARVIVRGKVESAASEFAEAMAGAFREALRRPERLPPHTPGLRLLGPAEAPVFRLNNQYRFHFQLQSASAALLHQVLREVVAVAKPPAGVEFQVDIDPYSMM